MSAEGSFLNWCTSCFISVLKYKTIHFKHVCNGAFRYSTAIENRCLILCVCDRAFRYNTARENRCLIPTHTPKKKRKEKEGGEEDSPFRALENTKWLPFHILHYNKIEAINSQFSQLRTHKIKLLVWVAVSSSLVYLSTTGEIPQWNLFRPMKVAWMGM